MNPKDVALTFNDAINIGDVKHILDLEGENFKFVDIHNKGFSGKEKSEKIWGDFFEKYPEYKNIFDRIIEKGNSVIMCGHAEGYKEMGNAIWIAKIRGRKVEEWRVYKDNEENRNALGIH